MTNNVEAQPDTKQLIDEILILRQQVHQLQAHVTTATTQLRPPSNAALIARHISFDTYDGTRDSTVLDTWIRSTKRLLPSTLSEEEKLLIASSKLVKEAALWYAQKEADSEIKPDEAIINVEELFRELRKDFVPINDRETHFRQLIKIKQEKKETVKAYITRFKALLLHVKTYDNQFMKEMFLNGLSTPFRAQVILQRPQTLEETYIEATNIEDSFGEFLPKKPLSSIPTVENDNFEAMEIDTIGQRLGPSPRSIEQRLGNRPTPERRNCFECGKPGHLARDCFIRKRRHETGDFSRKPPHPNSLTGRTPLASNNTTQNHLNLNEIESTPQVQGNDL